MIQLSLLLFIMPNFLIVPNLRWENSHEKSERFSEKFTTSDSIYSSNHQKNTFKNLLENLLFVDFSKAFVLMHWGKMELVLPGYGLSKKNFSHCNYALQNHQNNA